MQIQISWLLKTVCKGRAYPGSTGQGLASVAQSDARPTRDQKVTGSIPPGSGNILSCRLIMQYFLRPFFSLPLIQEGLLSASGRKNVHKILVNRLED